MQSLHSWSSACLKFKAQTLDAKLLSVLHGAFPVQVADVTRQGHQRPAWHASLGNWHARCPHPQAGRVAGEAPSHAQRLPRALLGVGGRALYVANLRHS